MTPVPLCVADASALYEVCRLVPPDDHPDLFDGLEKAVNQGRLGFPRKVVDELALLGRDQPIWAWARGIRGQIAHFDADITNLRPLMGYVRDVGFPGGFESLSGKDEGCIPAVGCLCLQLEGSGTDFVLATEDTDEHPLRPTMQQVADFGEWSTVDAAGALEHLRLGHLIP